MTSPWPTHRLGDVCQTGGGGTPLSSRKEYYEGGTIPWLVSGEVAQGEITCSSHFITELGLKNSAAKIFPEDTVLVAMYGATAGQVGILRFRAATNQAVCGILPSDKFVPKFMYYLLLAKKQELVAQAIGNAQPNISQIKIRNTTIPVPPLSEQQRIVAILDEAFAGLATATVNAEKNLKSARELFDSYLNSVFDQSKPLRLAATNGAKAFERSKHGSTLSDVSSTRTGGRTATTRHIEGKRSLCVGMPKTEARSGWAWRVLDSLARMESGHTPSRRHPEYWGGDVPWIGIRDAKSWHGREIVETLENTNELGLANSSARLLPVETVCLSRTASVGYVTVMGRPMATSQDFINWVCSEELSPRFLMYLFLAQGDEILKFSSGAVHQTIYFPEAKAFHICLPPMKDQRQIVEALDTLRDQSEKLEALYTRKLFGLTELRRSILEKAFAGELTSPPTQAIKEAAE